MRPGSREHWAYVRQMIMEGQLTIPRGAPVEWIVDDGLELVGKPVYIVDGDRRMMLAELPPREKPSWVLVGTIACLCVANATEVGFQPEG